MAKNKISEWSSTPASNTDVGGINIGEGMLPSDVNNAIREIMAQVKDQQVGTDGDNFTVGGNLNVTGTTTVGAVNMASLAVSGALSVGSALTVGGAINGVLTVDDPNNRVGINNVTPAVTLDLSATDAIRVPVGTTAQRPTGVQGYIRYNTTLSRFESYNGTAWGSIGGGATGGGADEVFVENNLTITNNYTITAGKSASSVGNITVNTGVTVTVPSGSRWVIL